MNLSKQFFRLGVALLLGWSFLFLILTLLASKIGYVHRLEGFVFILQISFQALIIRETCKIQGKMAQPSFFRFFNISNSILLFKNSVFYLIFFVFDFTHLPLATFDKISLIYTLPLVFGQSLLFCFWLQIFNYQIIRGGNKIAIFSSIIVVFLMTIIILIDIPSWHYQTPYIPQQLAQLAALMTLNICLILLTCITSLSFYLLISGMIIELAKVIWNQYFYLFQAQTASLYGNLFWLLGPLLIFLGLKSFTIYQSYTPKRWFRNAHSIQSQVGFWIFLIAMTSFIIARIISINISHYAAFPWLMVGFPLLIVLLSIFMGRQFSLPFRKLTGNINQAISGEKSGKLDQAFSIEEFIFLNQFVLNTIHAIEEKEAAKKRLVQVSTQVAHDIASPLMALDMLTKKLSTLPENERLILRNVTSRIYDIANNLIHVYQGKRPEEAKETADHLISAAILTVLSEKRMQFDGKALALESKISETGYFAFGHVNLCEFKRMLSNLINNAAEALDYQGKISVLLDAAEKIVIQICDHGAGIPQAVLQKLGQIDNTYGKKHGSGLGLAHAITTMETLNGDLTIHSDASGTLIKLTFPAIDAPPWFARALNLPKNVKIMIVDDDKAIHAAWDERFKDEIKTEIIHFSHPETCIDYLKAHEEESFFLLTDYEFLDSPLNGLDVIKAAHSHQAVLVTSYFERIDLQQACLSLNAKILPKNLTAEVGIIWV